MMSERTVIQHTAHPNTINSLVADLQRCGLCAGQTLLVHSSLSALGWVCGGAPAVVSALITALNADGADPNAPRGTLMMPTHTASNTEPSRWRHPAAPQAWWDVIRQNMPAFDPLRTPTLGMGAIPENFRRWPDVLRSAHPVGSFAALGPHATWLLAEHHGPDAMFGKNSPIERLYELDGHVLLLGVGHDSNTSLHLAEYRADYAGKTTFREGCAMLVDGTRQWVAYDMLALDDEDFKELGAAYEAAHPDAIHHQRVGAATARHFKQRQLVDFAITWMQAHRVASPPEHSTTPTFT